ncbi:10298_t:CDS:2 [Diversispora eburnea]|uniref:10298_t:CDS:1 n=1 Tax=Diversispora eburnea TaxID=1213867 RepID=A0A9N8V746_9GLOM|nr:10298_t:CDS:2 [Diversispora eburnea]
MNSSSYIRLYVFFLAALLTFVPIVRANCTSSAVYSLCKQRGSSNSALCTSTDYICLCDAVKAISECYRQCTDDPNTVAEAEAYSQVVAGSCNLAASQSATMTFPSAKPLSTSKSTAEPSSSSTVAKPTSPPNFGIGAIEKVMYGLSKTVNLSAELSTSWWY